MDMTLIKFGKNTYEVNLNRAFDLSIPPKRKEPVNAYDLPDPSYSVFSTEGFVGNVRQGGSCNCDELYLVPHGNGTHTECVGHISVESVWLDSCLKQYFFPAVLISVEPEEDEGLFKINRPLLESSLLGFSCSTEALIIRTLPNKEKKKSKRYAGSNPPFITKAGMEFINEMQFRHILVDIPSVDEENDPELSCHHIFWEYPKKPRRDKTITELIFVPDEAEDGLYWLNLQVPSLQTDAVPSRPVIFSAKLK